MRTKAIVAPIFKKREKGRKQFYSGGDQESTSTKQANSMPTIIIEATRWVE